MNRDVERIAVALARRVRREPNMTMGALRKTLAARDRHLFAAACALAIHKRWIARTEGDRLIAGVSQPADRAPDLASQVDRELASLRAFDDPNGLSPARDNDPTTCHLIVCPCEYRTGECPPTGHLDGSLDVVKHLDGCDCADRPEAATGLTRVSN